MTTKKVTTTQPAMTVTLPADPYERTAAAAYCAGVLRSHLRTLAGGAPLTPERLATMRAWVERLPGGEDEPATLAEVFAAHDRELYGMAS